MVERKERKKADRLQVLHEIDQRMEQLLRRVLPLRCLARQA